MFTAALDMGTFPLHLTETVLKFHYFSSVVLTNQNVGCVSPFWAEMFSVGRGSAEK